MFIRKKPKPSIASFVKLERDLIAARAAREEQARLEAQFKQREESILAPGKRVGSGRRRQGDGNTTDRVPRGNDLSIFRKMGVEQIRKLPHKTRQSLAQFLLTHPRPMVRFLAQRLAEEQERRRTEKLLNTVVQETELGDNGRPF